ncbi:sigma-70 family RNA polymerase sigma factor [Alkalibacillus aidingensis]|uniref:sigma-70 family RNA polymerase sigma factor n=1 Tax=Alkalibacillus aidingensis TaxID=2747607 RepID=UPI0016615C19|nr:sigma-70 family RNA polymerase sigma factor [Alkalibacillus aidingensis]
MWLRKKQEDDAFVEQIQSYQADLYRTAYAFLKNKDEALDAVQEVIYRAYRKRKQLKQQKYTKTWVIRIMINYCQDLLRKQKRVIYMENVDSTSNQANIIQHLSLEMAIEKLSNSEQELIFLKYFHGLTYPELSEYFQVPQGTLKTRVHTTLKKLRYELMEDERGESNGAK